MPWFATWPGAAKCLTLKSLLSKADFRGSDVRLLTQILVGGSRQSIPCVSCSDLGLEVFRATAGKNLSI